MPEIEELIEAIIKGNLPDDAYEALSKVELHGLRHSTLQLLLPALPVIDKIRAAAWEEGSTARDKYHLAAFTSNDKLEQPKNPYGDNPV